VMALSLSAGFQLLVGTDWQWGYVLSSWADLELIWNVVALALHVRPGIVRAVYTVANLWTGMWMVYPVIGHFSYLVLGLWAAYRLVGDSAKVGIAGGGQVVGLGYGKSRVLGDLLVSAELSVVISRSWRVVTEDTVGWARVRMRALKGDHVLKVLLAGYVETFGGSVADSSRLEQLLMSDAAFVNTVRRIRGEWWEQAPVSMRGKPAATLLESAWGVLWESDVGGRAWSDSEVQRAFVKFLTQVAAGNGYVLSGLALESDSQSVDGTEDGDSGVRVEV